LKGTGHSRHRRPVGLQNRVSGAKDLDMIMPQPCGTRGWGVHDPAGRPGRGKWGDVGATSGW